VVNMVDKKILKPTDEDLLKYYSSWIPFQDGRVVEEYQNRDSHWILQMFNLPDTDVSCCCNHISFSLK
jgi:hypothetical protein